MKRQLIFKIIKTVAIVASVVLAGLALSKHGSGLGTSLQKVSFVALGISIGISLIYRILNAGGWIIVLRALGIGKATVGTLAGIRLWLVAETMRWLPGSIWGFCSRVQGATALGVPASAASLSLPLELILTIGAWVLTAVVGLSISGTGKDWLDWLVHFVPVWVPVVLVASAAIGGLILQKLPNFGPVKKVRGLLGSLRKLTHSHLDFRKTGLAALWYFAMCLLNGVAFYFIVVSVTGGTPSVWSLLGINAVGWLVGFFAFFAPGGIGVREATITAMLLPICGAAEGALIALLWRVTQVLVELICLAPCLAATAIQATRPRPISAIPVVTPS